MPRRLVDRRDLEPRLAARARELRARRHVEGGARVGRPLPRGRARAARDPRQRRLRRRRRDRRARALPEPRGDAPPRRARRPPAGSSSRSDVAGAVAFLCSRRREMVCGQTIIVDGGFSLPRLMEPTEHNRRASTSAAAVHRASRLPDGRRPRDPVDAGSARARRCMRGAAEGRRRPASERAASARSSGADRRAPAESGDSPGVQASTARLRARAAARALRPRRREPARSRQPARSNRSPIAATWSSSARHLVEHDERRRARERVADVRVRVARPPARARQSASRPSRTKSAAESGSPPPSALPMQSDVGDLGAGPDLPIAAEPGVDRVDDQQRARLVAARGAASRGSRRRHDASPRVPAPARRSRTPRRPAAAGSSPYGRRCTGPAAMAATAAELLEPRRGEREQAGAVVRAVEGDDPGPRRSRDAPCAARSRPRPRP